MAANQPAYMVVNMERDGIDSKKVRTSSSWIMCGAYWGRLTDVRGLRMPILDKGRKRNRRWK